MKRLERLTALLSFLQARKYASLADIIKKFGVSERTIYRDLQSLQESGAPIAFENEKGYFILNRHFLLPLAFTIDEAKSLIFVERLARKYIDQETFHHFSSALEKIKNKLRDHQLDDIEKMEENIGVYVNPDFSTQFLSIAEKACRNKEILEIKYEDIKGQRTSRRIEPIGLTFYSQDWHLIAYCYLREDYRDFSMQRLISVIQTGQQSGKKRFTIEEYVQNLK